MNAARIKSMRDKAKVLEIGKWPEAAMLMREAADELERIARIEAAFMELVAKLEKIASLMCPIK